jgi:predicted enzyme related to lactoylglutathione lyase
MPTIVHFDLPVDDLERAKKFYKELFDWKINEVFGPMPYCFIETTDMEGNPGVRGGMGNRGIPEQKITNYIGVPSVDEYLAKVEKLGGKIIMPRTTVPGWGYLAICVDTENNTFGLWKEDENAK